MEQPRDHSLPGVKDPTQLIQVLKGVFGLPDAPRAWWNEFSKTLTKEFEMEQHTVDQAFFIWRHASGEPGVLLIVHVDDILVAHDSSAKSAKIVERLKKRYPFGDWKWARDGPLGYTGMTLETATVDGKLEVRVQQSTFVQGRLENMDLKVNGRSNDDVVSPIRGVRVQVHVRQSGLGYWKDTAGWRLRYEHAAEASGGPSHQGLQARNASDQDVAGDRPLSVEDSADER